MAARIIFELEGRRREIPLDRDEFVIGRQAANDVVIDHPWISRRHARLYREGERWRVEDLGSLNGTQINNLGTTEKPLSTGDTIYLYKFPVTFLGETATRVSLTPGSDSDPDLRMHTVVQSAVDFSALASRKQDPKRFEKLLTIVTKASETIVAGAPPDDTFRKLLDLVFEHLPVERGLIMVWDEDREDLDAKCVKQRSKVEEGGEIRFSRTIAEKVYNDKVAILTTDAQADTRFDKGQSVFDLGIRSAIAAPLWNGERVDGLIYVDTLYKGAFDDFDLDLLSALGNHVAVAVEQSRLQDSLIEQKLMRRRLERYHSPAVVELITSSTTSPSEALMADEREVTVLFADVVGFTRRCESMKPLEIAELLNRYFSVMTEAVFEHQGTVDKFIGDCIMAVFGAPLVSGEHAVQAVEAALEMRCAMEVLNEGLPAEARVRFRVGVHSGPVVAGDIGSAHRMDYTVLGSTVNLAARLESSVAEAGQIVISQVTRDAIGKGYRTRPLGERSLKGITEAVECHELVGRRSG
jgi:adenylate cyclase